VSNKPVFIDLFGGCGGLSLGLINAGWEGLFAVESNPMAFETLRFNLIDGSRATYNWPLWLPKEPHDIKGFIKKYRKEMKPLINNIDLIAGGPPCQGFSLAGKRDKGDERNQLFREYIKFVKFLKPKMILFENVEGIAFALRNKDSEHCRGRKPYSYLTRIKNALKSIGYEVKAMLVPFQNYGIPQSRKRYIIIGFSRDIFKTMVPNDPFFDIESTKAQFLEKKHLPMNTSVEQAISDLEQRHGVVNSPDSKGFYHGVLGEIGSEYQRYLRGDKVEGSIPDSHRFARHSKQIIDRLTLIQRECRRGVSLSSEDRKKYGLNKKCLHPTDKDSPAPTLTTLPDDVIHYSEPRIFTVREYARIQSFPDWFEFKSKYTTGGKNRTIECPRYTQIGNAVPPLFAELIGYVLSIYIEQIPNYGCNYDQEAVDMY